MKPAALHETHRPAVVLLHSSGSSPRQWQDLAEALGQHFRVLTAEFHGHGMRPGWGGDGPFTLAEDAGIALPLLEMARGAHLVGHSYGGAVALKIAATHPRLVRSVVAYEPVLFRTMFGHETSKHDLQGVVAAAQCMRDCVDRDEPLQAARRFIEFWSGAGAWQALPASRQEAMAVRMPSVIRHFDALFTEPDFTACLARSGIPMLLLGGARTAPAARRIGQLMRGALPLAEHQELPGMGHMGPITHAARVNERIARFLHAYEARELALMTP